MKLLNEMTFPTYVQHKRYCEKCWEPNNLGDLYLSLYGKKTQRHLLEYVLLCFTEEIKSEVEIT